MNKKILGMGNAVLDVIYSCKDEDLKQLGLIKGQMAIVDDVKSNESINRLRPIMKSSGGSVANSIAGIGILDGKAGFLGRVKKDDVGECFISDIKQSGVTFFCKPATEGPPTAKCSVFVSQDGERTMQTFLGASVELSESDINENYFSNSSILLIEGYLWSSASAREAIEKAIKFAKEKQIQIVFSLSDAGLVKMFRKDFIEFIDKDVDILIGNEGEFQSLFENISPKILLNDLGHLVKKAIMTKGEKGVTLFEKNSFQTSEAFLNDNVLDTTGAGDMFAAGFLSKYNKGESFLQSAIFGCKTASKILSQYGGRPTKELISSL